MDMDKSYGAVPCRARAVTPRHGGIATSRGAAWRRLCRPREAGDPGGAKDAFCVPDGCGGRDALGAPPGIPLPCLRAFPSSLRHFLPPPAFDFRAWPTMQSLKTFGGPSASRPPQPIPAAPLQNSCMSSKPCGTTIAAKATCRATTDCHDDGARYIPRDRSTRGDRTHHREVARSSRI